MKKHSEVEIISEKILIPRPMGVEPKTSQVSAGCSTIELWGTRCQKRNIFISYFTVNIFEPCSSSRTHDLLTSLTTSPLSLVVVHPRAPGGSWVRLPLGGLRIFFSEFISTSQRLFRTDVQTQLKKRFPL